MTDIRNLKLNRNEKILSAALIVVTFFVGQKYIVRGWHQRVAELEKSVTDSRTTLEADRQNYEKLLARAPTPSDLARMGDVLSVYDNANKEFSAIVTELASLGKGDSLKLVKISTEKQVPIQEYTQTTFSLEVEASFLAIGKFMERLEQKPLLAEVDGVEVYRIDGELKRCSAKIKLLSYVVRK